MNIQVKPSYPKMIWSLDQSQLAKFTSDQLKFFSGGASPIKFDTLAQYLPEACHRLERCFRSIKRKYYYENGDFFFSHLHSDHYASYLYFLSNCIYRRGQHPEIAQSIFLLNKMLNGLDLFCAVEMPEVFLLVHPVGSVVGNAVFNDYLVIYQNCTIGSSVSGVYPKFGHGSVLFAKSTVIGKCDIGDNVIFGANSFVIDSIIPPSKKVVGSFPNHRIITSVDIVSEKYFLTK
jgi:serine O-acetyltransferase